MSHIAHERQDNVSGTIIGGDYVAWQVFHGDRSQSGRQYSDTAEQAETEARAVISALKAAYCGHPCFLYEDALLWTIKLWGGLILVTNTCPFCHGPAHAKMCAAQRAVLGSMENDLRAQLDQAHQHIGALLAHTEDDVAQYATIDAARAFLRRANKETPR